MSGAVGSGCFLLAASAAAAVFYFGLFHTGLIGDDAYLSFRYAQNLLAGHGLVFNPDEKIWGFTSPLATLAVALGGLLGMDLDQFALALGIACTVTTPLVVWRLARAYLSLPVSVGLSLFVLTFPPQLYYLGLETPLLVFLECLFLLQLEEKRPRAACFVAALACLTRPDAIVLVVPLLLADRKARELKAAAWFVVPGALWLAFALGYYGTWLPNSFAAKKGLSSFGPYLDVQSKHFVENLFWIFRRPAPQFSWWRAPVFLLSLVPLVFRRVPLRHRYVLCLYPSFLLTAYAIIGSHPGHHWEIYSAYFFFALACVTVFAAGVDKFFTRGRWLATALAFGALAAVQLAYTRHNAARLATSRWEGARHRTYREVAAWLRANVPPGARIAYGEPGTLAYFSDRKFYDLSKIVSHPGTTSEKVEYLLDFATSPRNWPRYWNGATFRHLHSFSDRGFGALGVYRRENP